MAGGFSDQKAEKVIECSSFKLGRHNLIRDYALVMESRASNDGTIELVGEDGSSSGANGGGARGVLMLWASLDLVYSSYHQAQVFEESNPPQYLPIGHAGKGARQEWACLRHEMLRALRSASDRARSEPTPGTIPSVT